MREIKFKAWDTTNKKWHTRVQVGTNCCHSIYDEESGSWLEFDEFCGEVVQWTGLQDRNGVDIYEGDQLYHDGNLTDELQYIGDVTWNQADARWEIHSFHGNFAFIPNSCIVQGNIYEEGAHHES